MAGTFHPLPDGPIHTGVVKYADAEHARIDMIVVTLDEWDVILHIVRAQIDADAWLAPFMQEAIHVSEELKGDASPPRYERRRFTID